MTTSTMTNVRRWPIPHSRLPFTNQDVTPIQFRGAPGLVSSVWGGHQGGRIYAWNPDTHESAEFVLPEKTPGAYMLQTASDGRVYLGAGNGDLLRFDPQSETVEIIVRDRMQHICWGGCVVDRYVVWSTKPGHTCVYDWQTDEVIKEFKAIDSETPPAMYAHNVAVAPDGLVLMGLNMPTARIVTLDLATMTPQSFTPDAFHGASQNYGSVFLDDETIYVTIGHHGARCALLRYPGFETIAEFDPPPGGDNLGRRGCMFDGRLHICAQPTGDLYALDRDNLTWELVCPAFDGGEGDRTTELAVHDDRLICSVTQSGVAVSFDPQTGKLDTFELPSVGHCEVRALCAVPEIGKVYGAPFITARFWSLDIETGESVDHGRGMRGGGQIDFAIWDPQAKLVYTSSYHETNLSVLDPRKPIEWPHNPRHLATAHDHDQMRDKALAFDGKHLWMGTCAKYGNLGGALCRIDPATGDIDVRRHIVPDQTITSVILADGCIYCGTSIHADGKSTPATQTHGKLIRVDAATIEVTAETTIGDEEQLFALAMVNGRLLAQTRDRFYFWDAAKNELTDAGEAPTIFVNAVVIDDDGNYWTSDRQTTGQLIIDGDTVRYEPMLDEGGRYITRAADGSLWLATNDEIITFRHDRDA